MVWRLGLFYVLVALAIFAVLIVTLVLASYLAFRRQRRDVPAEPGHFRLWGGSGTAGVGLAGIVAVIATAVVVPDMRQAAVVGVVFTAALLGAHALTRRCRGLGADGVDRTEPRSG